MALKFQDAVNDARLSLNDSPPIRYPDDEVIRYANLFMRELKGKIPMAFFGLAYLSAPMPVFALVDDFPLDDYYYAKLVNYLVYRAEAKNDEFGEDSKVSMFFAMAFG